MASVEVCGLAHPPGWCWLETAGSSAVKKRVGKISAAAMNGTMSGRTLHPTSCRVISYTDA